MSLPKPNKTEGKKWNLTKEEQQALTGMANVIGFIHDLIEDHMSHWIDRNVKTRLSLPPEQLVHVSIEKGEVTLVANDKSKNDQPGIHAGVHAEKTVGSEKTGGVQSGDAKVETEKQTPPPQEQPAVLPKE